VAAAWRAPDLFAFYLLDNQVLRFLDLRTFFEDDVPVTTLGFLLLTFVWAFPWSVFVLARPAGSAGEMAAWRRVVLVWAVVVIGFFALSRSKLEYYGLPALPALALLAAEGLRAARDAGRWLAVGLLGCAAVGAAAIWVGAHLTPSQALDGLAELNVYYRILRDQGVGFPFESPRPFGMLLQGLGLLLVAGWTAASWAWWTGRRTLAASCLAGLGAGIAALIVVLLHVVEPHHSAKAVAAAVNARAGTADVVAHEGSLEYSAALPLYTGRRVVVVNGARGDLDFASRLSEGRGWFLDREGFAAVWTSPQRVFLVTQRPRSRSVVASLPSVVPLGSFGSRWLYSNRKD
jgi:hypothetical protein